jgi:hypothetical protein
MPPVNDGVGCLGCVAKLLGVLPDKELKKIGFSQGLMRLLKTETDNPSEAAKAMLLSQIKSG